MASRIKLVQGDTRPALIVTLRERQTSQPLDLSQVGTEILMRFRRVGDDEPRATLDGVRLPGIELEDRSISLVPPYDQPGKGGRVTFPWTTDALAGEPGYYEGEVEVQFPDGTTQTLYDLLKFSMRAQVG